MSRTDADHQAARFDRVYRANEQTYGAQPSLELVRYVDQCLPAGGSGLDLAAGLGRDTLALAERGFAMTAVDVAEEGLRHLATVARERGLADRVAVVMQDMADYDYPMDALDVIVATTALDHIERDKCLAILPKVAAALKIT